MSCKILGRYPVNPDLLMERSRASFPPNLLTYFLEGDEEKTKSRKELEKLFYEDEAFNVISDPVDYMTYDEIYEEALIKASQMYFKALNLDDPREMLAVGEAFHHEATPLLLHFIMFLPALMGHATEEQLERWLPDAIELKVIGTYAQTELGHGTFIRGLETRATYDADRQEFVLQSPSLKSIKWWPGGLGKTANWAIVLAQLHTQGVCRGVHPFMVQLRDEGTHKPLEGIVIGEIGPKMGLKAADNGFLQLNNVRIPRNQMLMKNAQVEPDGCYIEPKSDKLTYGTMVFVRVVVIDMVAFNVGRAATIAVRYSAVRRQSEIEKGEGEVQILDYQAQQMKLLPAIAFAHAFKAAFVTLMGAYKEVADDIELRGDLEQLGQLHAMSSGLKALCSELGSSVIETCRRATGGHGYLLMSGLPRLYAATVAACTYEGENTVLYLQTARYLLKCCDPCYPPTTAAAGDSASSDPSGNSTSNQEEGRESLAATKYLRMPSAVVVDSEALDHLLGSSSIQDQERNEKICLLLIEVMKSCSQRSILSVRDRLFNLTRGTGAGGMSPERAWISCQLDLIHGAKSHLMHFLLSSYIEWVASAPPEIRCIMTRLALLLFYTVITTNFGDYMLSGLTERQLSRIRDEMTSLLHSIRPEAVTLVDAFDYHDIVLMSSLGCYDGAVYERMFDLAKRAPLNKIDPHPAFMKNIHSLVRQSKL